MAGLRLTRKQGVSPFRKIALGTWRTTYDPQVYGALDIRMEAALRYIDEFRAATGKRLTLTHLMAKAVGHVLAGMPDANAILRFHQLYHRDRIGVFFQVVTKHEETGEIDLSGAVIYDPESKTLAAIVDEFEARVGEVRTGSDRSLERTRSLFHRMPAPLVHHVLKATSFLNYALNIDLSRFGVPKDPFGSVMVTNVGSLGLQQAFAPLVPYSRVPIVIAMGSVDEVPVVDAGKLTVGKVMKVCATFDHRILDGAHAATMAKSLRDFLENPAKVLGPPR